MVYACIHSLGALDVPEDLGMKMAQIQGEIPSGGEPTMNRWKGSKQMTTDLLH
jgi:hypothetical protein